MTPSREYKLTEHRAFDYCVGLVGRPKSGKTELAVRLIMNEMKERALYVVAFDPGGNIPDKLHDGTKVPVIRHDTIAQCERALSHDGGKLGSLIHCIRKESADEVLKACERFAAASLQQNGGLRGAPVLCYIDEAVLCEDMNVHRIGEQLLYFVSQRRHIQCGIIYTVQNPRAVHAMMMELATCVYIFRMKGRRALSIIEERMGLDKEQIEEIRRLPRYEFICIDPDADEENIDENKRE